MTVLPRTVHFRRGGTSAFITVPEGGLPALLYWGTDLGELTDTEAMGFTQSQVPATVSGSADLPPLMSLVPSQSDAWIGTPGLVGSRGGRMGFPAFSTTAVRTDGFSGEFDAHDDECLVDVTIHLELSASGLLRARARLTNVGTDDYALDSLLLALPVPPTETRVVDQTGHHLRERDMQTHDFTIGSHERSLRIARGHTASSIHGTCEPGSGWRTGMVHYVHLAWSGNIRTIAEKDTLGFQALLSGELLLPGEVVLAPGEHYETPWTVATWGNGLDEAAARIHDFLRERPNHPRTPRPVTLNAWEAVYFDHSLSRLLPLVEAAAKVGVERFVLDDGWFGSRRDDTSGLGDWMVSTEVWPDGLTPLADAIHERGMQFGLWFEPEMVNPDSDVARAHPDWLLSPVSHRPLEARFQQVMDLTNPEAFEHVRSQILRVLSDTTIDYVKWDFNRDLYEAVSPRSGCPAYHEQTLAAYALMDAVQAEHPELEIESCAGGGGRVDLGILERAVRVWGSDCIDPLERQLIEAGTSLLLPPELVGSHIASTTSHTTGRTLNLTLRAATALFSHLGIEWDLTEASESDLEELTAWVTLHKQLRPLLHTGRVVHADHPDTGWWVHGVVSASQDRAVYSLTRMRTSAQRPTPPLRLPGLDLAGRYSVRELLPEGIASSVTKKRDVQQVPWWESGLDTSGSVLGVAGIRFPDLNPEQVILLEAVRR